MNKNESLLKIYDKKTGKHYPIHINQINKVSIHKFTDFNVEMLPKIVFKVMSHHCGG